MLLLLAVQFVLLAATAASSSDDEIFVSSLSSPSCSSPPSSIEVCLSSVFSTMETELTSIALSLKYHEASLSYEMHHEHTLLSSEVSWVSVVSKVAKSVKSAVSVDYEGLSEQIYDLEYQKSYIMSAYYELVEKLNILEAKAEQVKIEERSIYVKYESVRVAKWSLYSAISAIVAEKAIVVEEEAEISIVVNSLNIQVSKIAYKIAELNERQQWLESWEVKFYEQIEVFESDVKKFRNIESDLVYREISIYKEQERIIKDVGYVQYAMQSLYERLDYIKKEIVHLEGYKSEIESIQYAVSKYAKGFISAYEEFTCEDSLLYYEACSSPAVVSTVPVAPKAAVAAAAPKAAAKPSASVVV